jgi:hypothetical protein
LGYEVNAYHFGEGSGGSVSPSFNVSAIRLIQTFRLPTNTTRLLIGCARGVTVGCLPSDTRHQIDIIVLRDITAQNATSFWTTTLLPFIPLPIKPISTIYPFSGLFYFYPGLFTLPVLPSGALFNLSTTTLGIVNQEQGFYLNLNSSTVIRSFSGSITLQLHQQDIDALIGYATTDFVPFRLLELTVNGSSFMNISMLCEPLSLYSSLFICLRCKRSLQ